MKSLLSKFREEAFPKEKEGLYRRSMKGLKGLQTDVHTSDPAPISIRSHYSRGLMRTKNEHV